MPGLSFFLRNRFWDHVLRAAANPDDRPSAVYAAIFTTIPGDDGTGGVEPVLGYARQQIPQLNANWAAAALGATSNQVAITFGPAGAGGWGKILGVGLFDAVTGGNLLAAYPIVGPTPDFRFFAYNGTNAFQIRDHPFTEDDPVFLFGGQLPAPLLENTEYYVKDQAAHVIKLYDVPSGSVIVITGDTGGLISRSGAVSIAAAQSFRLNAGDLAPAIVR